MSSKRGATYGAPSEQSSESQTSEGVATAPEETAKSPEEESSPSKPGPETANFSNQSSDEGTGEGGDAEDLDADSTSEQSTHNQAQVPQSAILNQMPLTGVVHPDETVGTHLVPAEKDVPGNEQRPVAERRAAADAAAVSHAATPEARARERAANTPVDTSNATSLERPLRPEPPTRIRHDERIPDDKIDGMGRHELRAVMEQRGYEVNEGLSKGALRDDFKRQQADAFSEEEE